MPNSKIHFLFTFLRPRLRQLLLMCGITVIKAVLVMIPPLVVKQLFDRVISGGDHDRFVVFSVMLLAIPFGIAVTTFAQVMSLAVLGQRVIFDVRTALFRHLEQLSLRFYNKFGTGMLVNRLMGDTTTIQTVMSTSLVTVISDIVVCTVACIAAILLHWRLGLVLILIVVLFVVNYRYLRLRMLESKRRALRAIDRMSAGVQERLNLNLTVRTYGREETEHETFSEQTREAVQYGMNAGTSTVDFASNTELLTFLGWGVVYFSGCAMVLRGSMTYGGVIAFTAYAMQVLQPAVRFSTIARQIQDVSVALDRLFEIHRETSEVQQPPAAFKPKDLSGRIDFDHVRFHYEAATPVLTDFDLHVEPGETIALVGPTGCGKSTVLNLLFRFYDVIDGRLRIDDRDISTYDLRALRRHFGIVLQEPMLFEAPILENIRFARPRLAPAKVEAAARLAEIHEFIRDLDDGYDTILGGRYGISLSAGQQQQLTIARAIAADPRILVMDEATSNLDSESEARIQRAMDRVLSGRTCFVVAHRLSTIRNASRIAYIEAGAIRELGSHDELMALAGGCYRELYLKHIESGSLEE